MVAKERADFIDLNGDGIDDRLQLRDLGPVARLHLWLLEQLAVAPAANVKKAIEVARPVTFAQAIERIKQADTAPFLAPSNPRAKLPDGYEYRSVQARGWSLIAFGADIKGDDVGAAIRAGNAGMAADLGALSFALASEAPDIRRYPQYALAIGEAICNDAEAHGITLHQRVTMEGVSLKGGRWARAAGHYGRQSGRWCASLQWPTYQHVEAARLVLGAYVTGRDLIGHRARRWIDCRVMDKGFQAGKALAYDARGIVRKWGAEGWELADPIVDVLREQVIDQYALALFVRRGGKPDVLKGLLMVEDGRRRWGLKGRA